MSIYQKYTIKKYPATGEEVDILNSIIITFYMCIVYCMKTDVPSFH